MKFFTLFSVIAIVFGFEIRINETIIFNNSKVHPSFNYSLNSDSCHSSSMAYREYRDTETTEFIFIKNETDNITILTTTFSNPLITDNITKHFQINESHSIIEINHCCENLPVLRNSAVKWTEIFLNFIYKNEHYSLKFIKFCEDPSLINIIYSGALLFILATFILAITSYKSIKFEKEIVEQGEIQAWQGLVFIIIGSIVLLLIFYFIEYANIIMTCLVIFQTSVALYLTIRTIVEETNIIKTNSFLIQRVIFDLRLIDIIISILTLILILVWLVTKNWVFNNILGFSLIFTVLSIFHVQKLKICAVILGLTFLYDVFWVYISSMIFTKNVMATVATELNLPIKLEFPVIFGDNPLRNCMFLGLGDIVIPGLAVKFCRKIDLNKKINIYYKSSIGLYILGLIMCGVVLILSNYPQPALLYLCPSLIFGISLIGYLRKEFYEIWNGEFQNIENDGDLTRYEEENSKKNSSTIEMM